MRPGPRIALLNLFITALEEIESFQSSCVKHDIELEEMPVFLGRVEATVAQLVGEYYRVTMTRECLAPHN